MRIYLSSAMQADPSYRDKFAAAAAEITLRYPMARVENPVEIADRVDRQRRARQVPPMTGCHSFYLLHDLKSLAACTHIIRIADGMPSSGADIELAFAAYAGIERLPDLELP